MNRSRHIAVTTALAVAIFAASVVGVGRLGPGDALVLSSDGALVTPALVAGSVGPPADTLDGLVTQLQTRLELVPGDHVAWATLGIAYVQQARVGADPSLYPRAEGALDESLAVQPDDNFLAEAGLSALASARHRFAEAKVHAERGLEINEFSAVLWGALSDAELQLGNYAAASAAVERMLALSPDTASYSRASYLHELRGETATAVSTMEKALEGAGTPSDRAFARTILGDLAFNAGDPGAALTSYNQALAESPSDAPAMFGKARAEAALGQVETALDDFADLVERAPEPSYLIAYGELLESLGRDEQAADQYTVVAAVQAVFEANGVESDAAPVLFLANHGEPARALAAAEAAIDARPFLAMYDAYAWALHANGRHEEALVASNRALQLGTPNASFLAHRGQIRLALGDVDGARADLASALDINPVFDPLDGAATARTLTELGEGS